MLYNDKRKTNNRTFYRDLYLLLMLYIFLPRVYFIHLCGLKFSIKSMMITVRSMQVSYGQQSVHL